MTIFEGLLGLLEAVFGDIPGLGKRRHPLPALGMQLRARQEISLEARDLRPRHEAGGFRVLLPANTLVRVERTLEREATELWVRPVDSALVELVPHECRRQAAAYGFEMDVPRSLLRTHFDVVPHSPLST